MAKLNGKRTITTRITPMLWFDTQGEEAANFYVSIFPNSRITEVSRFPEGGPGPAGSVMVVGFELDGQPFTALNGGPRFKFTEAISLVVNCDGQREVDRYWDRLLEGGGTTQACGWLKDRFGLSWQVVPTEVIEMLSDPDPAKVKRTFGAVMQMVKLDLDVIRRAYDGR
ncbi:MAG TPA: VOC family protein [Steroidobacteraceae bacterium]|jgi:predicted 3-demethylubiquinone-9 3-methyltransferase (glyoxalase superfamily)|nr:VOC family protein [Steroidobacteraceae bacterium]